MNQEKQYNTGERAVIYTLSVTVGIVVTLLSMLLMAVLSAAVGLGEATASPLASVCAAAGSLCAAFLCSKKIGSGGLLNGLICGAVMFLIVLLISLAVDRSGVTLMTLFHFVIILLAALIGGILGVNSGNKRKIV